MAFQISPGVNVTEIDLTTIIPAVSTTTGAFAGHFNWGPAGIRVLVDSEDTLVNTFQKPNTNTASDFFTAANFLAYGNALYVTRVIRSSNTDTLSTDTVIARNATTNSANTKNTIVKNEDDYQENYSSGISAVGSWIAKYPGELGNSLRISVCPTANAYQSTLTGNVYFSNNSTTVSGVGTNFTSELTVGDVLVLGPEKVERKVASIGNTTSLTLQSTYIGNTVPQSSQQNTPTRKWEFWNYVSRAPGTSDGAAVSGSSNDEMHIVVADEDGLISGIANSVLEVHESLSKASDGRSENGSNIYYKRYMNDNSRWVWWTAAVSGISTNTLGSATNFGTGVQSKPVNASFVNGRDGSSPRETDYINGYNLFRSSEDVDVSLVLGGAASSTRAIHIINNIVEARKDAIAVLSPTRASVVNNSGYPGAETDDVITFRNTLPSSSYAVMDSGWKYQYDKYNDIYRYVPLNGDTAGTMVRTDNERDPWWSPAGYNRGQIKNAIRLSYNPGKTYRDALYKAGINPVVTFPGQGTVLFGDKTLLNKPSAFDRINVRRLFIVLEKAIATAAKFTLFEFNDAFTRAQFKALVEPFLRDVQGRRGITDFRVVCDETNNTAEVIDRNEFVGDIYIKPARSINFIQLNFVAVRTGVDFTEIVGKF